MSVDAYFKLGDAIKGEVAKDGKDGLGKPLKDQIEVIGWSWGGSQAGTMHSGTGGGSGKVNLQDLTVTKYVDLATNDIFFALCSGEHIPTALLTVLKAGGNGPLPYFYIEFEDVLVSSYNISGAASADDRLIETFSINFARARITYALQSRQGGKQGGHSKGWDIPAGKAWS